jgi:hypothetical protein
VSKTQISSLALFIILTLLTVVFNYFNFSQSLLNFVTLFGTSLSIFGIYLTYIQILSVKQTNDLTHNAIVASLTKMNQIISISDLSKAIKTTHEIQGYIVIEKYELALLRMRDLKLVLIQAKFNEDLHDLINNDLHNTLIKDLGINIINVNDYILEKKLLLILPK